MDKLGLSDIEKTKEQARKFVSKYWAYILAVFLLLHVAFQKILKSSMRFRRYVANMKAYVDFVQPRSIASVSEYISPKTRCKYRLYDFYIASSFRSYLGRNQINDYVSTDALKYVITAGARLVHLDIYCEDLKMGSKPIVTHGFEVGNYHFTSKPPTKFLQIGKKNLKIKGKNLK